MKSLRFFKSFISGCIFGIFLIVVAGCSGAESRNPASDSESDKFGNCKIFFNRTGHCANLIWEQLPDEEHDGSFYLEFFEQNNPSVPVAPPGNPTVFVGVSGIAAVQVAVEAKNFSQYFVSSANISAPGSWEIRVQISTELGPTDQGVFNYKRL